MKSCQPHSENNTKLFRFANVGSGDKPSKQFFVNSLIGNLNMLCVIVKGGFICEENDSLSITIYCHSLLHGQSKLLESRG